MQVGISLRFFGGGNIMRIGRVAAATVIASVLASITDWLFMGMLFHDRYLIYPEVWRGALNESTRIIHSELVGILACLGFVLLCTTLRTRTTSGYLTASLLVWLAAAVPMLVQDGVWMKLDPMVLAAHAAGWLVRFAITAIVCGWLLRPAQGSAPGSA
jgi:hypothetical protein